MGVMLVSIVHAGSATYAVVGAQVASGKFRYPSSSNYLFLFLLLIRELHRCYYTQVPSSSSFLRTKKKRKGKKGWHSTSITSLI